MSNRIQKIADKIRRRSGYALHDLRGLLSLNAPMFRKAGGAAIIVYHGICQRDATRFNSLFLSVKTFERHLQFYKEYFHIVSLEDYYAGRFRQDRYNICLTFDDGFANNFKYALPLMDKYQAPMTFFVTGIRDAGYGFLWNDYLGFLQKYGPAALSLLNDSFYRDRHRQYISATTGRPLRERLHADDFTEKEQMIRLLEPILSMKARAQEEDYWLQMTEEQIKQLSAHPLATIGCHGYYHNDLSKIPLLAARDEMIRVRSYLTGLTQKETNALAFPYGSYTRELVEAMKQAGFDRLLALDFLFPEDAADGSMRERLVVNPYLSVNNQMTAIIYGKYR